MRLYVNIDHVATLREARQTDEPDPVRAADVAERAGADGITVHLREDRRHIQDADVRALKAAVRGVLNLELGAHDEIVRIACRVQPFQATLVPERRQEITTEGGLALRRPDRKVGAVVRRLTDAGIRVSLFIDPDVATIDRAVELGVPAIELHTGRYAHTWRPGDAALRALARAAAHARARGLAAHAVLDGRRAWDAHTKQLAVRAVDDLKIFVRRAGAWTDADTAKAEALGQELDQMAGRPSAQIRAAEALGLDAGARAFVAREGAAIASALDRAAQALRANPLAHDPLQHVLRALQPLRGLAALADLPPLPDLLDGIERTIADLSRSGLEPPANVAELFQTAATAIARSAHDVAERGRPDPEGAEFRRFAELLVQSMESEPDVVSIGALYYNDSGPHLVSRGVPVARPSTLGRLELVSHGEHLRQAADSLERAPSATQRELRAHTLGSTFRALANAGGGILADRVAEFAVAARDAVANGSAVGHAATFAAELRQVGDLLAASNAGDEDALAAALAPLIERVRSLGASGATHAPRASVPAAPPPPAPTLAPRAPTEAPDLAGSWAAYERLVQAGVGPASLQELVAVRDAPPQDALPIVDIRTPLGASAFRPTG